MTQVNENYRNLIITKSAKLRKRVTHAGDEPLHTCKNPDGTYTITWALPDDPKHSTNRVIPPKRKLTQRAFIIEQAEKENVEII